MRSFQKKINCGIYVYKYRATLGCYLSVFVTRTGIRDEMKVIARTDGSRNIAL